MTDAAHAPSAIFLIDTENLFYDYGLWLSEKRFGYRKHLCAPGLAAAVVVDVDRAVVRAAAERALEHCIAWSEFLTQGQVAVRSYGKDVDEGVRSVRGALEKRALRNIDVPHGPNKADLALRADFERSRESVDMFVFGGEDHLLRRSVHQYVHKDGRVLNFAFIVPERNFGALATHELTADLNAARTAMLVDSPWFQPNLPELLRTTRHRQRYYAALCEAVVPTAATIKADLTRPAKRAATAGPAAGSQQAAPAPPQPTWPPFTNPWELIALKLMADLHRRPTIAELAEPAWRDTLRRALQRHTPDLSHLTDQLADRLHRTFTHYPVAAEHLELRNQPGPHAEPGSGWPVQLAAAALMYEVIDEVPDLSEDDPRLTLAYRRARRWIDSAVS